MWEEVNRRGSGVPGFRIASKQQPAGEAHRSMALRRFARIHWRCLTARALVGCADRSPRAVSAHTGHCRYRFRPPGGDAAITAPAGRHAPARRRPWQCSIARMARREPRPNLFPGSGRQRCASAAPGCCAAGSRTSPRPVTSGAAFRVRPSMLRDLSPFSSVLP